MQVAAPSGSPRGRARPPLLHLRPTSCQSCPGPPTRSSLQETKQTRAVISPSERRNQSANPSEVREKAWPLHISVGIQLVCNRLQAGDDHDGDNKYNILPGSIILSLYTAGS